MAEDTPDYTGASSEKYIDKYTDRPEHASNLEEFQKVLSDIGMFPGVGEPADWLNALIYGVKGEPGMAALYGSGIGAYGGLKLFRGVPEWFRKSMVKEGKYVGGDMPGWSKASGMFEEAIPSGAPYLSDSFEFAKLYAKQRINKLNDQLDFVKNRFPNFKKEINKLKKEISIETKKKTGKVLEFDIPEDVLKILELNQEACLI